MRDAGRSPGYVALYMLGETKQVNEEAGLESHVLTVRVRYVVRMETTAILYHDKHDVVISMPQGVKKYVNADTKDTRCVDRFF